MSVLVAYASHSGATATLAETVAATLAERGITAASIPVEDSPDPGDYNACVLGSGIRYDALEKTAVAWARDHHDALANRPFALFTCSGSAADPAKAGRQKGTDAFIKDPGPSPIAVKNFPGWVIMERLPIHEKVLLTGMRTPIGDFRDLDAVRAWTRDIIPLLHPGSGAADQAAHGG
ncbi:MAG: flavodoxin domain-containing protein [Brachybacterium sp.]|nr:flavodoxin domain-containing protein [Brachybacterium sp.]